MKPNKAPKFTPFAALTPRDGDKTRRPLARRYIYLQPHMLNRFAIHLSSFVSIALFAIFIVFTIASIFGLVVSQPSVDPMHGLLSEKEQIYTVILPPLLAYLFYSCAKQKLLFHVILLATIIGLAIFGIWSWLSFGLAAAILLPCLLAVPRFLNEI